MAAKKRVLEICCTSLEDALAAERGGADRIELCEELWMGGVTPDDELITAVVKAVAIPIFVLVRPRGGDFVYDDEELREMVLTVTIARDCGASGIVSGALTREAEIDRSATRALKKAARDLPFTFHRAFDEVADQGAGLEQLRELGVDRVLAAGGHGAADPARLAKLAGMGPPSVLACGGVRSGNITSLVEAPDIEELHSAARAAEGQEVDEAEVRALRAIW